MIEKNEVQKNLTKIRGYLDDAAESLLSDKHLILVGNKIIVAIQEKMTLMQSFYQQQEDILREYQPLDLAKKASSRVLSGDLGSPYFAGKPYQRGKI